MAVDVGSAVGYLDLDIKGFLAGLKSAQSEADKTSNNITKMGSKITSAGNNISKVGSTLTKTVTVPLVGIGVAGLKVATDFEKGMSEVRAISGATGKDFDALREKAIELGADTAFSSGEVASAMTEMAKAGWDSQQIIDGMSGVLAAAAASGEGLATVSTIVADSITGFGLAASDSTRVADLLTQAANSGTIGITDLGESFKYIAPVAGSMGLSIEDVTTAISAMSMAGIKGSAAGTSLRTMLTNLVKPTDNMAASMKQLGISATNSDGSMKSLDAIIANLREGFNGLTEEEKAYHAATLAGKEGMSGLLAILNLTEEEYNAIAESMDNCSGVAEETAAIMQDNLQSKLEQLGGALESLAIKLADLLLPHLNTLVTWLTTLVDKFTALSPETQKTILVIAGIAAAIGPATSAVGKLTTGVGNVVTAFGKLSAKKGAAAEAITSVGDASKNSSGKVNTGAASFGNLAGQALKLVAAGASFLMIGAGIKLIAESAISLAQAGPGAAAAFVLLTAGAVGMTAAIVAIGGAATVSAAGLLAIGAAVALVSAGIALLVVAITGLVETIADNSEEIEKIIEALAKAISSTITTLFNSVTSLITGVIDSIGNAIVNIVTAVGDAIAKVNDSVSNLVKAIGDAISGVIDSFAGVIDSIGEAALNAGNGFKILADAVINLVNNTGIGDLILTLGSVAKGIKEINTAANDSDKAAKKISEFAKKTKPEFDKVKESIKDLEEAFKNAKFEFNTKIKLPHFSMKGSFNAQTGSVPSVSVSWYKKAMNGGMILNGATIFGMDSNGNLLGGGEAGSEVVVGTKSLMQMISQSVADAIGPIVSVAHELAKTSAELGYVTYNGFTKLKENLDKDENSQSNDSENGDTFIFNSPKPIDEIEAAKQMKKAKRELAEGF